MFRRRFAELQVADRAAERDLERERLRAAREIALTQGIAGAIPQIAGLGVQALGQGIGAVQADAERTAHLSALSRLGQYGQQSMGPRDEGAPLSWEETPEAIAAREAQGMTSQPLGFDLFGIGERARQRAAQVYQAERAQQIVGGRKEAQGLDLQQQQIGAQRDARLAAAARAAADDARADSAAKMKAQNDLQTELKGELAAASKSDLAYGTGREKTAAALARLQADPRVSSAGITSEWLASNADAIFADYELQISKEARGAAAHKDALVSAAEVAAGKTTQAERAEIVGDDEKVRVIDATISLIKTHKGGIGPVIGMATSNAKIADITDSLLGTKFATIARNVKELQLGLKKDVNEDRLANQDSLELADLNLDASRPAESLIQWLNEYRARIIRHREAKIGGRDIPGRPKEAGASSTTKTPPATPGPTGRKLDAFR